MLRIIYFTLITIFLNGCTPSVGVGVPIGKYSYAGVNVSEDGLHPSAGVGIGL